MDALIQNQESLPPEVLSRLKKMQSTASKALQEVRRFSHELRPSVLEHFGLSAALELIVGEFNDVCNTVLSFSISGSERRLPPETELALFRITQEAMNNIRKHSQAATGRIDLKFTRDKIKLSIIDNGKGFNTSRTGKPSAKGGLGMLGMRERAHLVGAVLKVKSQPDRGTVISVELPLVSQ